MEKVGRDGDEDEDEDEDGRFERFTLLSPLCRCRPAALAPR